MSVNVMPKHIKIQWYAVQNYKHLEFIIYWRQNIYRDILTFTNTRNMILLSGARNYWRWHQRGNQKP